MNAKPHDLSQYLSYFSLKEHSLTSSFKNPFDNQPDELSKQAARLLIKRLSKDKALSSSMFVQNEGKMFGVLVVATATGQLAYLSAFSGMLQQQWLLPGFVPPIFDEAKMAKLLSIGEQDLATLNKQISVINNDSNRQALIDELEHLNAQSKAQLTALKAEQRINKAQRKKLREKLALGLDSTTTLSQLSAQSQNDKRHYKALKNSLESDIKSLENTLNSEFEGTIQRLKKQRKQRSQEIHQQVFAMYQLLNNEGEVKPISDFFKDALPPGGTGDCAAPKLLQFAFKHQLTPLSLSEFWWGASPKKEIRHHQQFYPPCRSRCHHILPFMLDGMIEPSNKDYAPQLSPVIEYEDDDLIVLNKPAGMLSIPGKEETGSVLTWLKQQYPNAQGALLVHRLDQATSGLMLAAKNAVVHKALQKQFLERSIKKRYVALLSKKLGTDLSHIDLPLRVDLDDRPRQLVCFEHGKSAQTTVKLIAYEGELSRVYFYPHTGRTHQLRIHAAHALGLNNPIVGDALYGQKDQRLMLHAQKLTFFHPVMQKTVMFLLKEPF